MVQKKKYILLDQIISLKTKYVYYATWNGCFKSETNKFKHNVNLTAYNRQM